MPPLRSIKHTFLHSFYLSMLHLLGGTPEVTPIEGVACIPTGDCRQEISKPDYQLACQGIGRPGQGFQDNCQIAREMVL